jgi:hypothetical protein
VDNLKRGIEEDEAEWKQLMEAKAKRQKKSPQKD